MALSRPVALVSVVVLSGICVAAQPTILASMIDRCAPVETGVEAVDGTLWVVNTASSPGVDWVNMEAEVEAEGASSSGGLASWVELPVVSGASLERRVGTVALGWPMRWRFCQWTATTTEHFFPPMAETEEPCQSLRRAVRDWGTTTDGATVRSWTGVVGLVVDWAVVAVPLSALVLCRRHSAGSSGTPR